MSFDPTRCIPGLEVVTTPDRTRVRTKYGVRKLGDEWQVFVRGRLYSVCMCKAESNADLICLLLEQNDQEQANHDTFSNPPGDVSAGGSGGLP